MTTTYELNSSALCSLPQHAEHGPLGAPHLEGEPIARGVVYGNRGRQLLVDLDCKGASVP